MAEYIHLINGKEIAAANVVPNTPLASALEAISAGAFRIVPLDTSVDPPVPNPAGAVPPAPLSPKIIYLTKDDSSTAEDPYTEWIYQPDGNPRWVVIGTTSVDISDLEADVTSNDGTNVQVRVVEASGKITEVHIATDNTENVGNKVKTIRDASSATDTAYPSEAAVRTELDTKADKVTVEPGEDPEGHIPQLDENGNLEDSGIDAESLVTDVRILDKTTSTSESVVFTHVASIPKANDYTAAVPAHDNVPAQNAVASSWGVVQISTIEL
jgi:hypothetical protein